MVYDSVNSVPMWSIRIIDEYIDVYRIYGNNDNLFSMKIHYAGMFTYVNGTFCYVDVCDIDEFSVHELNDLVRKLGYSAKVKLYYHFRKPDRDLDTEIEDDVMPKMQVTKLKPWKPVKGQSAKKLMLEWNGEPNVIDQDNDFDPFLDLVTLDDADREKPQTKTNNVTDIAEGSDREESNNREEGSDSGSSDGNDSDELVDNENLVEHVHVDMDTLDKNNADKLSVEDRQGELNAHEDIDVDLDVIDNEELESASNEDGLERVRQKKLKQLRKKNKPKHGDVHKYYFYVGQDFVSKEKVKDRKHGRLTYDPEHKCLQSRKIKYSTANFLSEEIMDQIESNLEVPIKAIQDQLQKKYQVEVSRMKAFRAKSKVVDQVRRDYTSQYHILRSYVIELKASNPNTTMRIGVESKADHTCPIRVFKMIYICLGAAKACFKAWMRDFLEFDGAFMKGSFPGQLLTAVAIDSNNGMPCKHVVAANWNMAANNMELGLPETWCHHFYRLDTWKAAGQSQQSQPLSFLLNFTLRLEGLQKREKSAREDILMVKHGKLSRRLKTVTCVLCHSKGHNKTSCKGPTSGQATKTAQGGSNKKRPADGSSGRNVAAKKTKKVIPTQASQTTQASTATVMRKNKGKAIAESS
uniref:PB1-like domain-containing protein n=1 Tax=Tanacetum cinerariifolium TaxID=118510 RepID=A0A699HV65_TANCI|nr:hypothetical protein [Tanacetum cinerariifolium]